MDNPQCNYTTGNQPILMEALSSKEFIILGSLKLKGDCPKPIIQKIVAYTKGNINHLQRTPWRNYLNEEVCKYIIEQRDIGELNLCNQSITIDAQHQPKLYEKIKDISFPNLKYMTSWGNNIQSIECLTRIYWPNLQHISLWDNKIISLAPFRRFLAPKLKSIDLKKNKIVDHRPLSQFYNPSKIFTRIDVNISGGYAQFFKIEADSFQRVYFLFGPNSQIKHKILKQAAVRRGIFQNQAKRNNL